MGVLADWQIREEVKIEPFAEQCYTPGVLSYGLTSYGYDVRLGTKFKVFTNTYGAIVDPKALSPQAYVDLESDVCVIPPNSFILAESVESMEIPRDLHAICVGKSTYARCFSGNTRVALLDRTNPTFLELIRRHESGEAIWGYSITPGGKVAAALLTAPRRIGEDKLIAVALDNDEVVECTEDHKFICRDGTEVSAGSLRPGDSVMPLYRVYSNGYEGVYHPGSHAELTHRLSDEWNIRHGIYSAGEHEDCHHMDFDRTNNVPTNIARMDSSEHARLHNSIYYGPGFDADAHSEAIKKAFRNLSVDPAWVEKFSEAQRQRCLNFWTLPQYAEARERLLAKRRTFWASEEERWKQSERITAALSSPQAKANLSRAAKANWEKASKDRRDAQRELMRSVNIRKEITEEVLREALKACGGKKRAAARMLGCDRSVFRRFSNVLREFAPNNHKVTAVRSHPGKHDVYCLTAPEFGNFALSSGVFVRNCGLVVNVTPLEPEWKGKITIEISNTTPLPAKVYANEGIMQVMFLRADGHTEAILSSLIQHQLVDPKWVEARKRELLCERSYADKDGRYQSQKGLTLPCLRKE